MDTHPPYNKNVSSGIGVPKEAVVPEEVSIKFQPHSNLNLSSEDVVKGLKPFFHHEKNPKPVEEDLDDDEVIDRVRRAVIGSYQARIAQMPSTEAQRKIKESISKSVESNQPVQALNTWVPLKFSRDLSSAGVDVADLMALESFVRISNDVKRYYPPGVDFTVHLLDMTARYLEKPIPGLEDMMSTYMDGFDTLCQFLGAGRIRTVRESKLASTVGVECMSFCPVLVHESMSAFD